MKLIVISDIHGSMPFVEAVLDEVEKADHVVIAGDISGRGDNRQAESIISVIEKRNSSIIAVHGNWDDGNVIAMLTERGYSVHGDGRIIDGVGFFGVGGSGPTPMNTPTEYDEETIAGLLTSGYAKVAGCATKVLITHAPPRGLRDRTFLLVRGGSTSVRSFIDQSDVQVCICGHIHEARGIEKHEKVTVVNPGSLKSGKYAHVALNGIPDITLHRIKKEK
ncbi:MAG TPA: metallophosphoesterase family protein [Spirochaetota bacterium]|nr:metallophosphoesterase family protein [Spirochaetota bacterium]